MTGKRLLLALATLGLCAAAWAMYWFAPHKLFIDRRADEAHPEGMAIVASGAFRSLEHATGGTAQLLRLADGRHVLRLDRLETSNGPELHVILSAAPAQDDWFVYDDGPFVDLGPLKGNVGSSNYDIPPEVDLSAYPSAVVWCRRFAVGFGVAPLSRGSSSPP